MNEYGLITRLLVKHARDAFRSQADCDREWRTLNFTAAPDLRRARAVLAQQCHDLAAPQGQADRVVRTQCAEGLGNTVEAEDNLRLLCLAHDDFGSLSSMATVKLPSLIAASFSATHKPRRSCALPQPA